MHPKKNLRPPLILLISTLFYNTTHAGQNISDHHSYANPNESLIKHIDIDLAVDFDRQVLHGHIIANITKNNPNINHITLDTRDLNIHKVTYIETDTNLKFKLGEQDPILGTALTIMLPKTKKNDNIKIKIQYQTSPQASGLQWLTPEQTAGKTHPFLFSQSQAIHARSWLPLQDSPSIRITFNATIRTPTNLLAVMSASNSPAIRQDGVYQFTMQQPIPSYLLAIAVGKLSFKAIGKQTGVYAEPPIIEAAANEFADTQTMLEACEKLYGPYRWERYDLLILPPSFPYGGMENPRLSFITPTIITGDKSLVNVIAHELAHSWSGNLVSNASWQDLWLNEGFTSYTESRIMETLFGPKRAAMENVLGYESLLQEMNDLEKPDTRLSIDLIGRDPDIVFSNVPYVKGQLFITFLEKRFGRAKFDLFLNQYFQDHAFQSISTNQFLGYLKTQLLNKNKGIVERGEIKEWIYQPGLPATTPIPKSDAFLLVKSEMQKWLSGTINAKELNIQNWVVHQWLYFLNELPDHLGKQRLTELDNAFNFTQSKNNEIAHAWLLIAIKHDYQPAYARLEEYLIQIGRQRLIIPLYKALVKTTKGFQFASKVYKKAKPGYHPLTITAVDKALSKTDD